MSAISLPLHLRRRGLALLVLLAACALFWALIVRPILAVLDAPREEIKTYARLLANYRGEAGVHPDLANGASKGHLPGLVVADNAALAAAEIQGDVKALIEAAGGSLSSTADLPPASLGKFEKDEVRFDFALPMNELAPLLYRIESHTPYLFVSEIEIGAPQKTPGAGAQDLNPTLRIEASIEAYRLRGGK